MCASDDLSRRKANLPLAKQALLQKWTQGGHKQAAGAQWIIPRAAESAMLPLSFGQEWYLDKQDNTPAAVWLIGKLNVNILWWSFQEIVERHEVLRTTFVEQDGRLIQKIAPGFSIPISVEGWEHIPLEKQESEAIQLAIEEARCPFVVEQGPLFRIRLLRFAAERHILVIVVSHIIADGRSFVILFHELATLYSAFDAGEVVPLVPPPVQYADVALWQRERLQSPVWEEYIAFWRRQLEGVTTLRLPADFPNAAHKRFRGVDYPFPIAEPISATIKRLNQQEKVTTFMTMMAVFGMLLHSYTGQLDFLIGFGISNRQSPEVGEMIGLFGYMAGLRLNLAGDPNFLQILGRIRKSAMGVYAHQELLFERVMWEIDPGRDLQQDPVFRVVLVIQNEKTLMKAEEMAGVSLQPLRVGSEAEQYDLVMVVFDTEQGLRGICEYNAELFRKETIARLTERFQRLLSLIGSASHQPLSQLLALLDN